ncbi:MAG TPA: FmdB family zinc ribbon protein [Woeseiaceae bacterium]
MPIYAYACDSCEHAFDALQKMTDDPLVECPECGRPSLKKLLSAPKFRLKGQGWYETDFKTGDKRNLHGEKDRKPADSAKDTPKDKPAPKPVADKAGDAA